MSKCSVHLASVCVVAAVLVGCGGGGGASGFIGQFCDIYRPCCAAAGLRSDGQQCRALYGALLPSNTYDAMAGEACLAAVRAQASQPGFCAGDLPDPPECNRVLASSSSKAPGATCTDDNECAPSTEGEVECNSAFPPSGEIRKCQVVIRGTAGSTPCLRTVNGNRFFSTGNPDDVIPRGYACYVSDGLRCDEVSTACVALTPVGQRCSGLEDCVDGAYCDFTAGTCIARKAVGAACTGTSSSECVDTAYCRAATSCAARQVAGTTCMVDDECTSDSCVNMMCETGTGNFTLTFICGQP
ncbi:MAG TPA: hypothetical protein VFH68_25625 [Polyangia bacterium]|jgi:hypothetical protein|nr:hypothetical protein [Polyangia bacterium]